MTKEIELKTLVAKRATYFARIQRLYEDSKNIDKKDVRGNFIIRYNSLEETRKLFSEVVESINRLNLELDAKYVPNFSELDAFDELYCHILEAAKTVFSPKSTETHHGDASTSASLKATPRLPKIELMTFSGEIREWPMFYETFKNLIHENPELEDTNKLHYLLGKLTGKALAICAGIQPCAKNYQLFWSTLVDKYQDERLLANNYLSQILEFRPAQTESSASLNAFIEKFDTAVTALKNLNIEDLGDFVISSLALSKLDSQTQRAFEMSIKNDNKKIPKYEDVIKFIKGQTKALSCTQKSNTPANKIAVYKPKVSQSFVVNNSPIKNCLFCEETSHLIFQCGKFLKLNPSDRYKFAKEKTLCLNCLSSKHKIATCKSSNTCFNCKLKHHTLLHFDKPAPSQVTISETPEISMITESKTINLCCTSTQSTTTLLATVVVKLINSNFEDSFLRFIVDTASQSHFLTAKSCRRLGLPVSKFYSSVSGIGNEVQSIKGKVHVVIASRFKPNFEYSLDALVIDKITDHLPSFGIEKYKLEYLLHLPLADETFFEPNEIDGIIGAELVPHLIGRNKVLGPPDLPIALETTLGYIVMGKAPIITEVPRKIFCCRVDTPLETLVEKFWVIEDIPTQSLINPEDIICETIFQSTVNRESSGKYTVALPFKEYPPVLGDSYTIAYHRFLSLEKKFRLSATFAQAYADVIRDYIDQGHISLVSTFSKLDGYYIPHHAVYKESSSTPLRIVFDASAKTTNSLSLNSTLYTGEKLQSDVLTILLNFRLFAIAMISDVRQMYRQIWVHPEHRRYQRILWRFSPEDKLDIYEINTVSFGVKSSPFLALRVVKQLAKDERKNFPVASEIACRDTYMDDVVTSVSTSTDAIKIYHDLVGLFKAGGFELVKWSTNSPELLEQIPTANRLHESISFDDDTFLKVLGFQWHPGTDFMSFSINLESNIECTKRNILSTLARIWDPLGLLSPVTLYTKLLIKELWKQKIDWDVQAPLELKKLWDHFLKQIHVLKNFQVPRHLSVFRGAITSCIGFSDASENGFGAVVYLRVCYPQPIVTLVCAKSKVAPLKIISIPRLELCAALLLSKLMRFVIEAFKTRFKITNLFAFTDSTVVLDWINSSPARWCTFVANRVTKIQELIPITSWYHIEGKDNVADCVSRGFTPKQFINYSMWLNGPDWLVQEENSWPIETHDLDKFVSLEERASKVWLSLTPKTTFLDKILLNLVEKCSSWTKLRKAVVYVFRFVKYLSRTPKIISIEDLEVAERALIRAIQRKHFSKEFMLLENGELCSPYLRLLCPFVQNGLIRVGGRLRNSSLSYDQQHPYLLPKKDHLINLIVDHYHKQNLHTGPHLLLSLLRQKFWILSGRDVVRQRIRNCNFCFKFRPRNFFPIMADLPAPRITEAKPFLHTGVDYAGPFLITLSRHRGVKSQKAYLCLFVCLVTKALHLELASDLSTATFLGAFKRFLGRRGPCSVLYSDCGSNFVGAKSSLDDIFKFVQSENFNSNIANILSQNNISWKLNPPSAPHFGGLWESNVKAVKTHLVKLIANQILSYEELTTVFIQIEALLNSRPLCCLSSDPNEPQALTPAHFLTGTPLKILPARDLTDENTNLLSRKDLLDQIVQSYWKRWHLEYLHTLQTRQKWNTPANPIKVGTVVIVRLDNAPPLQWPLGVIESTFPGTDGVVRVASVRTKTGLFKRPVVKLCPLPTQ